MKPQIIPKKVVDMSEAIKEADKNGHQLIIIQKRQYGKTEAYRLAREAKDVEIIPPIANTQNNT